MTVRTGLLILLLFLCAECVSRSEALAAERERSFSRDVLPILSDKCFQCHGPDEANREGGLRLDKQESAFAVPDSGTPAIVAGDSASSQLMERITTSDANLQMPPSDSGKSLTPEQIETVRQWIDAGAVWTEHWAFQPPQRRPLPAPRANWEPANPIDFFIHQALADVGLAPEQQSDRESLIRRLTLDLIGLPPTVQEVDDFLKDDSVNAYERVVDRLLNSPRYGEHMARIWLDAARYGDTHGLHLDNERSIWPYRDWVISAFNNNQSFDRFTIEQLAGDLLPEPTLSQRVATGFNRCNVTTSEGGSIDDEYYMRYAVDRVETTATVWLGLTAGCAACHDHKFDPLTQREFYQLFSYYYSLTEQAMDGNALLPPPFVKVPTREQETEQVRLRRELSLAEQQVDALLSEFAYSDPAPDAELGEIAEQPVIWIDDALPAGANAQGNGPDPWKFVESPEHPVYQGVKSTVRTGEGEAITQHFFTDATDKLPIGENARLFAWVYLDPENPPQTVQLQFNDGSWDHRASWGADKAFNAGRNDATNRRMGELPKLGEWVRLEVSADEVGLKQGSALNGWAFTQVGGTVHWDAAGVTAPSLSEDQKRSQWAWEQFRKSFQGTALPEEIQKLLDLERSGRSEEQRQRLARYFLEHVHPESLALLAEPQQQISRFKQQLGEVEAAIPATLVMEDRTEARQAYVLARGEYTEPRDPVQSDVPIWLAPRVEGQPANRLGLALWLVQPNHPLTSRVAVNRFWQQLFGVGLVKSSEDFGLQGEQPSHPELLDWLAIDFVESGWDVKRCLKQMVLSKTYQQSSRVAPAKLSADPENRLLSRGPRFRLDAEVIRDQALSVSGLLIDSIGGQSVKPYQPAGLWKPVGFGGSNTSVFVQDKADKLFRRSMYTFWKRTVPPPSMATFDAPNRETCQVRRARTNTPLQALVLMNDVQFVEAARRFAERAMVEGGTSTRDRIEFIFRVLLSRKANDEEVAAVERLLQDSLAEFQVDVDAAAKLLSTGEAPRNEQLNAAELAAWTMVTHLMLNLSEAVTKG